MNSHPTTEPKLGSLGRTVTLAILCLCSLGCTTLPRNDLADAMMPSNYRNWSPEFAVLPTIEREGDVVTVRNVRNISYVTEEDYVLEFEDRTYDLEDLETVDFFVVPFAGLPMMAHTMISFGFKDDRYLAVSAEIRTEKGEKYSPVLGVSRQYEITYVAADERDIVRLRTKYRDADVYLYRTRAAPEKARQLFESVAERINKLAEQPEFYDTVRNNCTTNIVRHVNEIAPRRVPYSLGVLLPGYADRYAYDLGLLDSSVPFSELKRQAWINDLADRHFDAPDFSQRIRMRITRNDLELEPVDDLESDGFSPAGEGDVESLPEPDGRSSEGWIQRTGYRATDDPDKLEPIPLPQGPSPTSRARSVSRRASQPAPARPPARPGWFDLQRWSQRTR